MTTDETYHRIAERLGGRLLAVRPLAGGVSATTSLIEVQATEGPRRFVVRQPGWCDRGASVRRDSQLLGRLADRGLRAPRPVLMDADGALAGRPTLVLTHLSGESEGAPKDIPALASALAAQLAAIHATPAEDLRPLLADRDAEVAEVLSAPPERLDASAGEAEVRAVLARGRRGPANRPGLLHGDFWPGNLLWIDGAISGVVDWEDAAWGDPLYDVAITRLDVLWAYGPEASEAFTRAYAAAAPQVDLTALPWFDLTAALRPAGQISRWAAVADDPPAHARRMRERLASFREAALAAYALLTR
jgi:aminoglycoside phosphotransferase (APT) family kinase protein